MNVIYELLHQRAAESPDQLALANSSQHLSFSQLKQAVDAAAYKLLGFGVSRGQMIGVKLPDYENWIISLALAKIGAIGWSLPEGKEPINGPSSMRHFLVSSSAEADSAKESLTFDPSWLEPSSHSEMVSVAAYEDEDFVRAIATSGTTGNPKLALFSHRSLVHKLENLASIWAGPGNEFNFMPLAATGGFSTALVTLLRAKPYLARDTKKKPLIDFLVAYRVEVLSGSPDQISGFIAANLENLDLLSGVTSIRLAGSFPGEMFLEKVRSVFPAEITSVYGSTETGAIFTAEVLAGEPFKGLGRLVPGCSARVVDARGVTAADGSAGHLQTRSGGMYSGYLLDLETMAIGPAPEWFDTSDMVSAYGEVFTFLGRDSNVLNIGGVKFDVSSLEDFVRSLPGVQDALSFAAEDREGKEVHVMAIVSDNDETVRLVQSQVNSKYPRVAPAIFWRTAAVERVGLDKAARWKAKLSFEIAYRKM